LLIDLTALEMDGQVDAIINQAESDFKRQVLNGVSPAQARSALIADLKNYGSKHYTGNFVGIKKKAHRMIADQEQRMVAKPVEDFKGERGQLYLWVRDPFASGCGDCLRHGIMRPRTKEQWLQLGRGLPRWGDTDCNIGCKCMLRPVARGRNVSSVSNEIWRAKSGGKQAREIMGVNDIRMQKHIHQQAKLAPRSTTYIDRNGRVVAVPDSGQAKTVAELKLEQKTLREKPSLEGRKVRGQTTKTASKQNRSRTAMEDSKVVTDERIDVDSGINESRRLSNGVNGIFKSRKGEFGSALRRGIKQGTQYKREVGSSIFDEELGLGLVPTTVMKRYKGDVGSFQVWKDGYMKVGELRGHIRSKYGINKWNNHVKSRTREGWFLLDSIQQNQDRHDGNWMAKPTVKKVKKKIDPRPQIRKDTRKQKETLKDQKEHLEIMQNQEKSAKVNLIKQKKNKKEWTKKAKDATQKANDAVQADDTDAWVKWTKRNKTYETEINNVDNRINNLTGTVWGMKQDVKNAKSKVAKTKRVIKTLDTKLKNAPALKTVTVDVIDIKIALIDNGLSHGLLHGGTSRHQPTIASEYAGTKVSPYWLKKLKAMKSNETQMRNRQRNEAGLSEQAINVFWERVDMVLDTNVHLGANHSRGFESHANYESGKVGRKHLKGSVI